MNIKEAKQYIKDTVSLYLKKDEYGEYRIPVVRQRPVFLLGAPGIGKTAIMEQIAQELGLALVSYSMTHHTRQSALGLPFIEHKNYAGEDTAVSEYTMSEIIASVYETMEKSGIKEGILFLDEINCVSETLAPSMLQFLQYKVFGRHAVPEGWVIVTAGNPPEYNKSVREFDVVTLDRLKILDVDADYSAWKSYAKSRNIHGAITGFLELNKDAFYLMETTAGGKNYVTARGWEDLSQIIILYEEENLRVTEELVGQYLRSEKIVREFTAYYDLFNKYKNDYKVEQIVEGVYNEETIVKAGDAAFDERISLMGLLISYLQGDMKDACIKADVLKSLMPALKAMQNTDKPLNEIIEAMKEAQNKKTESLKAAGALSDDEKKVSKLKNAFMDGCLEALSKDGSFDAVRSCFNTEKEALKAAVNKCQKHLKYAFEFTDKVYEQGNEMLILLTELTVSEISTKFLTDFGSEDYNKYSESMMLSDRHSKLMAEIEKLDL